MSRRVLEEHDDQVTEGEELELRQKCPQPDPVCCSSIRTDSADSDSEREPCRPTPDGMGEAVQVQGPDVSPPVDTRTMMADPAIETQTEAVAEPPVTRQSGESGGDRPSVSPGYDAVVLFLCIIGLAAGAWMNYLAYEGATWVRVSTVAGTGIGTVGFALLLFRREITEDFLQD